MTFGLRGRAVLVTGAGRGFGRIVARRLAAEGCAVALCARDDGMLATTIWPALTTIRHPSAQMARAAVRSLIRNVYRMHRGVERAPEHVRIGFELVRRQSDAAPRVRPQQSWEMAAQAVS